MNWAALPRPAIDVHDELDMVRDELAKAKTRDEQHTICLEAAHSQLAIVGCWAETCRNQAVAARSKQGRKGGRRIDNGGRGRILTDPDFLADIQRAEAQREAADAAKQARQDARKDKEAASALERERKDARARAWTDAKDMHLALVADWDATGRNGLKPKPPKRKDVWKEFDEVWRLSQDGTTSDTEAANTSAAA